MITGKDWMGERGRVITLKKKTIICQNLHILRCITSRTVDQNVPVWGFQFLSDLLFLSLYSDFVPNPWKLVKLGRHTILRISVRMLNPSTPCICQPLHLQIFAQMGSVHLMEKVHGKFCTCPILSGRHELN